MLIARSAPGPGRLGGSQLRIFSCSLHSRANTSGIRSKAARSQELTNGPDRDHGLNRHGRPRGHHHRRRRAEGPQRQPLAEDLCEHLPATGSELQANGHLVATTGDAEQQQNRNVRTDEQKRRAGSPADPAQDSSLGGSCERPLPPRRHRPPCVRTSRCSRRADPDSCSSTRRGRLTTSRGTSPFRTAPVLQRGHLLRFHLRSSSPRSES